MGLTGCGVLHVDRPPPLVYARYTPETHNDFGVAYEAEGDLDHARRQYRKAVEKDPANHVAWTNLGNVLSRLDEGARARAAYAQALALAPGYGPAVNNLAMSYLSAREPQPELAISILEAHLPFIDPDYAESVNRTLAEARAATERRD